MISEKIAYEFGSMVYEPFLGLCTVMGSSEETMLGVQQTFYELKPLQGTALVKVPASQMVSRGIRPLMSAEQLEIELGSEGSAFEDPGRETYAQRLKRWTQLLRSGRTASGYDFLREYRRLSEQGTRFSPKEAEMHENVQRVMAQEISEVLQVSAGKASSMLISKKENLRPAN